MQPVQFKGSTFVKKPASMTADQCKDVFVVAGIDYNGPEEQPFFLTAWQPSHEDIIALLAGGAVWVKTITTQVQPMVLFTKDKNGKPNK